MDQHMLEMFGAVLVAVITTLIGPVILEYVKAICDLWSPENTPRNKTFNA